MNSTSQSLFAHLRWMPYDADAKKGTRVSAAEKDGKKARKLKASGKVI